MSRPAPGHSHSPSSSQRARRPLTSSPWPPRIRTPAPQSAKPRGGDRRAYGRVVMGCPAPGRCHPILMRPPQPPSECCRPLDQVGTGCRPFESGPCCLAQCAVLQLQHGDPQPSDLLHGLSAFHLLSSKWSRNLDEHLVQFSF
uniref:Uncharacterized protein n=1 Tax=Arundo donax TaxID=35708 RepID=A0A0A9F5Y9_ARUDO